MASSSTSSVSGYSVDASLSTISLPKDEESMVKLLCQMSEKAVKRVEKSRRRCDKFSQSLKHLPEEQNRRLELLKQSVKRFEEAVYSGRLANAKNRNQHAMTMSKLCAYLEADPQQMDDMNRLETELNKLLEQVMVVHREYYQFEKRFDAEDLLNRVQEMGDQANVVEEIFSFSKLQTQPLSPTDSVMVLASSTAKDEVDQLVTRLKELNL